MTALLISTPRGSDFGLSGYRSPAARPSAGASSDAVKIANSLDQIDQTLRSTGLSRSTAPLPDHKTTERLFDALVAAKVMTSQVAMHLDPDWRGRLFAQLDDLLAADDWHEDDRPLVGNSFGTFLRTIIHLDMARRPGLGLTHDGNLIAAWTVGQNRLNLEFLPNDNVRWVLSCDVEGERERAAGETPVKRLPEVLAPYDPDRWLRNVEAAGA